uniref:Kinesin-like protein n=1 Tax=Glossina brevipalpis TaxID=37001 RepID=A0A1A9WZH7_9MUSC
MTSKTHTSINVIKTPRKKKVRTHCLPSLEQPEETNITKPKDPVQVFCRIKPLDSEYISCVRVKDSTTVVLEALDQTLDSKQGLQKENHYVFGHVFESEISQRDIFYAVALPLVENLIKGRNSLLFTYGITGSGKTHTMTGYIGQRGIMPQCLHALFRTVSSYQAKKCVFKPDYLNGFEVLSETEASYERQHKMCHRFKDALKLEDSCLEVVSQSPRYLSLLQSIDEDNIYAVFVTYIEIYNNSVYDLLEEGNIQKTLQSKIIREDANHNIFVHGATEIEVESMEAAMAAFERGQNRKRVGHTVLNAESSRSHSVFNIRLVQAPTDSHGEHVVSDKRHITVSQLSLVDLAGSERTSRTNNTGFRLREAGNINNSLMTLRLCLQYLRENQQSTNAVPKKIPYRDSKITHLFKNYFEGEGQVSMIVCINPRAEDRFENAHVMKFAEMTQQVQVARATPVKAGLGFIQGRRKANEIFKIAADNLNELGHTEAKNIDVDIGLVFFSSFPEYKIDSPEGDSNIKELMQYLLLRIEKRKILCKDLNTRCDNFRGNLMKMEEENLSLRRELNQAKARYKEERDRSLGLMKSLALLESSQNVLKNKLKNHEYEINVLRRKLGEQQALFDKKEGKLTQETKKIEASSSLKKCG